MEMRNPTPGEAYTFAHGIDVPPFGGGLCFHLSFWFLTDEMLNMPRPVLGTVSRDFLEKDKRFEKLKYAQFTVEYFPLSELENLTLDTYLVRLVDPNVPIIAGNQVGHWIVLTPTGVFDPGPSKKDIPLHVWMAGFERYRIARIYRYTPTPRLLDTL